MNDLTQDDIAQAVEVMRRGGVILYPTDTVWGLGCDACRSDAVQRIFQIKGRADGKALISLLADSRHLLRYVEDVPDVAYDLVDLATTPVTVVYDKALVPPLAPELVAPDGSIGIRITHEKVSAALCRKLGRPVVSTSANRSGQPTPATFKDITPEILEAVDYVMMSRRDDNAPHHPSCVIKLSCDGTVKILRK